MGIDVDNLIQDLYILLKKENVNPEDKLKEKDELFKKY